MTGRLLVSTINFRDLCVCVCMCLIITVDVNIFYNIAFYLHHTTVVINA